MDCQSPSANMNSCHRFAPSQASLFGQQDIPQASRHLIAQSQATKSLSPCLPTPTHQPSRAPAIAVAPLLPPRNWGVLSAARPISISAACREVQSPPRPSSTCRKLSIRGAIARVPFSFLAQSLHLDRPRKRKNSRQRPSIGETRPWSALLRGHWQAVVRLRVR